MIKMGPVDLVLHLVLATGHLEGRRPVSLLVVAMPGTGKSEILLRYSEYPCMMTTTYTSFPRIINLYGADIVSGKLHHMLFPDFGLYSSRPKWIAASELAALGSLIEEGVVNWGTQRVNFHMNAAFGVGIIASATPRTLGEIRGLAPSGFFSRFLKFFYQYSEETGQSIRSGIRGRLQTKFPKDVRHPMQRFRVTANPEILREFEDQNLIALLKDPEDAQGLRIQQQLESLAMAQTLLRGGREVEHADVQLVMDLCRYFRNYVHESQYPEI